jgi:8-oxo-dGTP diphosphatase
MIDKVAWIHIVERQLLSARSRGKDTYYLPGGKREAGESDQECLIREIREELAVDLAPESLRPMGQFEAQAHGQSAGVRVRMACYSASYAGTLHASAEIAELAWLRYADRARTSPVQQLIVDWLKEQDLID